MPYLAVFLASASSVFLIRSILSAHRIRLTIRSLSLLCYWSLFSSVFFLRFCVGYNYGDLWGYFAGSIFSSPAFFSLFYFAGTLVNCVVLLYACDRILRIWHLRMARACMFWITLSPSALYGYFFLGKESFIILASAIIGLALQRLRSNQYNRIGNARSDDRGMIVPKSEMPAPAFNWLPLIPSPYSLFMVSASLLVISRPYFMAILAAPLLSCLVAALFVRAALFHKIRLSYLIAVLVVSIPTAYFALGDWRVTSLLFKLFDDSAFVESTLVGASFYVPIADSFSFLQPFRPFPWESLPGQMLFHQLIAFSTVIDALSILLFVFSCTAKRSRFSSSDLPWVQAGCVLVILFGFAISSFNPNWGDLHRRLSLFILSPFIIYAYSAPLRLNPIQAVPSVNGS